MQEISRELLLLLIPIIVLQIVLLLVSLRDWLKKENKNMPNRNVWLIIILLISVVGPIGYLLAAPRNSGNLDLDDEQTWG